MTQRMVEMKHKDLDEHIFVAESAVPHHMNSGWAPVEKKGLDPDTASGPAVRPDGVITAEPPESDTDTGRRSSKSEGK